MSQFSKMIAEIDRGRYLDKVDRQIVEIIARIRKHGGKGSLTLTFRIEPTDHKSVMVTPQVTSKPPAEPMLGSTFYHTDDNELVRDDPDQPDLPGVIPINKSKTS